MINSPDWQKSKIKPHLYQPSLECIEEIAVYMESIDTEEMDCDTCLILQEILSDEIEDEESLSKQKEILIQLGREALIENGDWVIAHRHHSLELIMKG
jgi:hypothetical protein